MDDYQKRNAVTIDNWAKNGWIWSIPCDHESYQKALAGDVRVLLTPNKSVPDGWLANLQGKKVLGLASGGGQQMPLLSAAGAICTVFDISKEQLKREEEVAKRENYHIEIIEGDMSQPLPFKDQSFDMIFHPVSNCYVKNILPVWKECFRVLKHEGLLLAGFDNGVIYAFSDDQSYLQYPLPYNPLDNPAYYNECLEKDYGFQFSHTIQEQIGGQLQVGFVLKDIYEDSVSQGLFLDYNVPLFYATLAIKP